MITITGNSLDKVGKYLGLWFNNNSEYYFNAPYSALGFLNDEGNIKGVAIFNDYTGSNIEVHFHGKDCFNKHSLNRIATYVFDELKCNRLTAKPYSTNIELINYLIRLGFKEEAQLKYYYGLNEHAIVYTMTKNEANKWIKLNARWP